MKRTKDFKVSAIGSCRITTPLRDGQDQFGYELNTARCYGYCHSPAEAVQMARFMQGDLVIPEYLWPVLGRGRDYTEMHQQSSVDSDLYVIEISSAKQITAHGFSLQLNYLHAAYRDFFSDAHRAYAYWAATRDGSQAQFVKENWSSTPSQMEDAEVLAHISRKDNTYSEITAGIAALRETLPDIAVVTHIDAVTGAGTTIASRSKLIGKVKDAAAEVGVQVIDPTDAMHLCGQSHAISDESTGLAHYTPKFSQTMTDDVATQFILPRMGVGPALKPIVPRKKEVPKVKRSDLLRAVRKAGSENDLEELARLETLAADAGYSIPDIALWRSRIHFADKNYTLALIEGADAASELIENLGLHVLVMRSAVAISEVEVADFYAKKVIRLAGPEKPRFVKEAQAALDRLQKAS